MDGGEQTTISPEFLENIQSAVNSQGVLGQVQVIETENGPVTVLFMEEGADTSNLGGENITLSVDGGGQGLSETVIQDDNTQIQYQYHVQTDDDYSQLLQGAVGDTIVSVPNNTVTSVKEDLAAVEPVIDLPQVAPAVQSAVAETLPQPETETSTDTYYITDTGEILKIDSSLLGENAGDATLQLQTQDGTLQILNQVGNIQTTQVDNQLTTYTQPAVDNINITYEQSTPSFEYTATKVDGQGTNEAPRAEEPKVLSYKTTNRQRTNIMRQPISKPAPVSLQPKTTASGQTSLLQSQYSTLKQVDAGGQTSEILYPKQYQKQTIVFPKVQKQTVQTNVLKSGYQTYQMKAPPQKLITTVMKPQSLLKSNASNYMTSTSVINKPSITQGPVTPKTYTTSTYTHKQVPAVNKIQSQATRVPSVTKQQTDLLSVAMKQADVSHQILPSSVPEVKKVMTPAIIKEPSLSIPKAEKSADPVNVVKYISDELVSAKENIESSVPASSNGADTEKTTIIEEPETVPMETSVENVDTPSVSHESQLEKSDESKMETEEHPAETKQPVDVKMVEEDSTCSKTENSGPDSSSKQVYINRFSEKYLQKKNNVERKEDKTDNLRISNANKPVMVSSITQTTSIGSENDANNDGTKHKIKDKYKVLHSSRLKLVKSPMHKKFQKCVEETSRNDEKLNDRITAKKPHKLPIKRLLKCESCSFMTEQKSNLKQHMLEKHPNKVNLQEMVGETKQLGSNTTQTKSAGSLLITQEESYSHYFRLSKRNKKEKCNICRIVVPKDKFLDHLHEAHGSEMFSCGKCKKTFFSEVARLDHVIDGKCKVDCEDMVISDKSTEGTSFEMERKEIHSDDKSAKSGKVIVVGFESENVVDKLKDDFIESDSAYREISSYFYKCKLCKFKSKMKSYCLVHLKKHVGDMGSRSYKCFKCAKSFKNFRKKITHVRHVHSRKFYKCQNCPQSFASKRENVLHKNLHQGIYPFSCPFCRFGFMRKNILQRHLRKCGSAAEVRYLTFAESYRDKNKRLKKKKLPARLRCHACNKSFLSLGKLTFHKVMVHYGHKNQISRNFNISEVSKRKRIYLECRNLQISFTNEDVADVRVIKNGEQERKENSVKSGELNNVYDITRKSSEELVENIECQKESEFEKNFTDIYLNQAKDTGINDDKLVGSGDTLLSLQPLDGIPLKKLDSCSTDAGYGIDADPLVSVLSEDGLSSPYADESASYHLTSPILEPDFKFGKYRGVVPEGLDSCIPIVKPYRCGDCNILIDGEYNFKKHMQNLHTNGLYCKICKNRSAKPEILVAHMIDKHLVGKPLTCPKCNKGFKKMKFYWKHAKIHNKSFTCEVCTRSFKQKQQLTSHMKIHVEAKEFCVRCGELFDNHDLLRIHNWKEHRIRMNRRKIPLYIRQQRRAVMQKRKKIQLTVNFDQKEDESTEKEVSKQVEESVTPPEKPDGQLVQNSADVSSSMKSIDVPDSDVTIQLFADGTLVTRDKAGTNYSQVKLEDLGLDLSMLEGNTDIELLIVQGDGKEVRATINTSKHVNPTTESLTPVSRDVSATTVASSSTGTKLTASSASSDRPTATVNEARPYKCSMCPRTFKFYRTFRCHEIVHTKAVTFTCHLCQRLFAREVNLQSHLELHKRKGAMRPTEEQERQIDKSKCKQCNKIFSSVHALQRHMKEQHEGHPRVPCPICGKLFKNEANVQRHSKIHVGPFTCPHCIKVYTDRTEYYEHIKSEHEDLMYPCKACNAVLPSKRAFINHIKTQHNNRDELIASIKGNDTNECALCNKKFENESELEAHMMVHSSTTSHECPACNKKYKLINTLEKHIKEVHNNDVVFTCPNCEEKFEYKGKLDLHIKLFHTGNYQCLTCYEDFPERTLLEEHQHKDHDFALTCSKCSSKFDSSLKLKNHLKEHTSQNNLCDICGAGFEHKAQLRSHLINKHFGREKTTMLKKYPSMGSVNIEIVCDLCGEFWHNKPLYRQHLRDVHFGGDTVEMLKLFPTFEKIPDPPEPVTCDHCGKKCNSMVQLNFHLKTHVKSKRKSVQTEEFSSSDDDVQDPYDFTNIEPRDVDKSYKCKKCGSQFSRKAALEKHKLVHEKDEFKEALKNIEKEETARAELEELEGYKPTPKVKKVVKESLKKLKRGRKVKLPFPKKKRAESPDYSASKRKASKMQISNINDHGDLDLKVEVSSSSTSKEVEMSSPSTIKEVEFDLQAFYCKSCDKKFACRKNLRKHLRGVHKYVTKTGSELFKCTECEREFTMKSNMARHMLAKHDIKMDEDSSESPTKTSKKKDRKVGEGSDDTSESMDEDSTADITSFLGKNFNLGKTNSCNIQSVKKKQHRCNLCGEGFSRDATLKKHLAFHETEEDLSSKTDIDEMLDLQPAIYTCLSCGNKYSTALGLIHHTRNKHSEVDEETVLNQIAEVDAQLKLESPKKKSDKVNKKRKLEFDSDEDRENAKKRVKVERDGKEVYNCKVCGMIYYTYRGVVKHEKDVHHKDKVESPQPVKYSHSGRLITKSKKLSEQIHCDKCNKTFLEVKGLKQHIMRVHNKEEDTVKPKFAGESGEFKCELCPKEYDQKINLRRHMKMKHNMELSSDAIDTSLSESPKANLVYNCDVCIQKFSTLTNLRSHMISAHDENDEEEVRSEDKVGKISESKFDTEKDLEVHMGKSTGEKPYKCCLCNKHFISKFQLECHIKKLHPKQWAKKVKCKICLMLFETQKAMLKHKLTHRKPQNSEEQKSSKNDSGQHKCSECEKTFRWKRNLVSHIEVYHTESDPQTCGVCNKVFPDKESIKAHMTVHNKAKREIPTCKICDKTFRKQSSLKMHVAQLHKETPKPKGSMSCDICKESFATKMKLLEHMLTHTSVMPHKCDICSSSFHMETKLKAHKLTHKLKDRKSVGKNIPDKSKTKSDEENDNDKNKEPRKEYKCKKCSKKFRDILLLKAHVTKVHKTKVVIKSSLPKERLTRSRSVSETKVDSSTPASSKDKKQLKEKKVVKNEVKKAQSSFCKKCNLNFIKKESYEAHMKSAHENRDKAKKSDSADQGKNTEKKIQQKGTGNTDKSKKSDKSTTKKNKEEKKEKTVGYDCPICKKIFSKSFTLKSHIKNVHKVTMEDSPYDNQRKKCLYCNQCARVFWSQKQYDAHNKKFHPDKNALELDKQVMQAMEEGDIKTEPSDMAPKDSEFETIQHKCEFCSMVHWTKKLFDEHMLSEHPEHAAEYGITGEDVFSSPTIEFVNDSEDMMGNLLSVGLYDVSACNKLSSLPVVSIQRINGKLDNKMSPSKKSTADIEDESSSDAESEADEYTREYKKFLLNSVIDVSENTEETETEDGSINEQGTEDKTEENKIDDSNKIETETESREENEAEDEPVTGENVDNFVTEKDTEEIKEIENDKNDDIDMKTSVDEDEESGVEKTNDAHIDSKEVSNTTIDSVMLNEEDSSVCKQLQDEPEQDAIQNVIDDELITKADAVQSSNVNEKSVGINYSDESVDNCTDELITKADAVPSIDVNEESVGVKYADESVENCTEVGQESEKVEGKVFISETEKEYKEESEVEQEQEQIDWEAIDNDIEAAVKDVDGEDLADEVDEEDDIDDENKDDDDTESVEEIFIGNQGLGNEEVNDRELECGKVQSDIVEDTNTGDIDEKKEEENKFDDIQDMCNDEMENVESSVPDVSVSVNELIENKENDEMLDSGENKIMEEIQNKEIQNKETRTEEGSVDFENQEEMDTS